MQSRFTAASVAALAFALGACGPDEAQLERETAEVVAAFQESAQSRLQAIGAELDMARQQVDSIGGEVQQGAAMTLDALASRREQLEQRIRVLAWQGEMQWDSTTRAIEDELSRLRADLAAAIDTTTATS